MIHPADPGGRSPANGNSLTLITTNSYDPLDRLTQVTQGVGVQTRNYTYDGLGRLTAVATPETNQAQTAYQYDNFNNLTQRTDPRGVITTYGYDTLNRLASVNYNVGSTGVPATASVTYTYGTNATLNENGRLKTATDGPGSQTFYYDELGRMTKLDKAISGTTYTTQYAYNLASELSSITYPSSRVVQQNFDALGRLCAVGASGSTCSTGTNYASGFGYNSAGQVTGFNYGNGVAASFGYSADRLQLTSLSYVKGATTLLSLAYGYTQGTGNNGQITSITDNVDSTRSLTYSYDALYRLSTATAGPVATPTWKLGWTYDRYGNRTAQTVLAGAGVPSNSVTINPATNRITGAPYAYDANGNMTNDGANTMTYDGENHAVTAAGTTYVYDGNGLRVRKCAPNCASPTSRTVYIFSGSKVIAEYDNGAAPASPTREYAYSGGALLAKFEAGATNYYHPDHLSNRVITDSAGIAAGARGHYPYGESWYESGATTKLKFTTYERDSESGNDFALARYHVNRLGRFSSPDPLVGGVGNPQSLNRYAYTANDPVNLTDPSGLWCQQATYTHNGVSEDWGTICFDSGFAGQADSAPLGSGPGPAVASKIAFLHSRLLNYDDLNDRPPDIGPPDFGPMPQFGPAPQPCPPVPQHPAGASVVANIREAEAHAAVPGTGIDSGTRLMWQLEGAVWFYDQVRNKGPWNYKQVGRQYEEFGNFNYGATGLASGFSPGTVLRAAGYAQRRAGTSRPGWGTPLGGPPYGDDPQDQQWIKNGFQYYNAKKAGCIDP